MSDQKILALMIKHEIDYPEAAMMLLDIEDDHEIIVSEEDIERHILSSSANESSTNETDCTEEILF